MFCPNPDCPDLLESGEPGEYREGILTCPRCGAALVPEHPFPPEDDETPAEVPWDRSLQEPPVEVASFNYRQDAELACSMLEANGVRAFVFGDDCGSVDPGIGFGTRTRVMVPGSEAALAVTLLREGPGEA